MNKIRKFTLPMPTEDNMLVIEKDLEKMLDDSIPDELIEFIAYYRGLSLFERVYISQYGKWEVQRLLDSHWIAVLPSIHKENGYGKKLFFGVNPENKFFCISFDDDNFGKVVLLENFVHIGSIRKIDLPEGSPEETIIADSFDEFINGLQIKENDNLNDALHYCDSTGKIKYNHIKEFNIRPRMTEAEFEKLEELFEIKIPVYFKEFMKRYAEVSILESFFYREKDLLYDLGMFLNYNTLENILPDYLEDEKVRKLLPFAYPYHAYFICLSFEEDTYGKVVLYDYEDWDYDKSYVEVLFDNFDDFVNSMQVPKDRYRGNYRKVYYCDEDLVY